ncbi:winged helix family transcriptional regulator [Brevibacillus laterosporus]|nr:winged helix family transcriptional regulator [Brevibacillus laterosporus]
MFFYDKRGSAKYNLLIIINETFCLSGVDCLLFHDDAFTVEILSDSISFLPKEYALLQFLFQNQNQSLSREQLLDHVWPQEAPIDRTVDDHIYRLRKKLGKYIHLYEIETIRGRGYRFYVKDKHGEITSFAKNTLLQQKTRELLHTYHFLGLGEQLVTMLSHQQKWGLPVDEDFKCLSYFSKIDVQRLLESNDHSFQHRAYFLLLFYIGFSKNTTKALHFCEQALQSGCLPSYSQTELPINLISFYVQTNQFEQAAQILKSNWIMAREQGNEWLHFLLMTEEVIFYTAQSEWGRAEQTLKELEDLLPYFPGLRESGLWQIHKGLLTSIKGNEHEGVLDWTKGIEDLQRSQFLPTLLMALQYTRYLGNKQAALKIISKLAEQQWNQLQHKLGWEKYLDRLEAQLEQHFS